ncbi:MAG: hypothetical protein R6U37_02275 [Dehalococcoidia bacterium]
MKGENQTDSETAINIVITNGYEKVIEAVRGLLELEEDLCVIGQATDVPGTLSVLEDRNPDVLVLGLMSSEKESLNLAGRISGSFPAIAIVFISLYNDGHYMREAAEVGVGEYVALSEAGVKLAPAVRAAAKKAGEPV